MDAMEFVAKYPEYLANIKKVTKAEYQPVLEEMEKMDPHDLVAPESWFPDENAALGFVYRLFILDTRKI